jgi:hypothetical protein
MTTTAEKKEDQQRARDILEQVREEITSGNALLLISAELGKGETDYLRALLAYTMADGRTSSWNLTWAIAKFFSYSLRERAGYWFIAMGGGGYSKADEIARALASYYGIERVRYERN